MSTTTEPKPRELWIGWPDGENPTVCESYDLGCERFIEHSAFAKLQAEHDKLKADADRIADCLSELVDLVEDAQSGGYKSDSFTCQPARILLKQWRGEG